MTPQEAAETVREATNTYCTRYGTYIPADVRTAGATWSAHNECPPEKHVLVITPAALDTLVSTIEGLEEETKTQGKRIHDEVRAGFEHRLKSYERIISEKDRLRAKAEHNLMRAAGKREAAQDKLHLAIRQIKDALRERDEARAERDRAIEDGKHNLAFANETATRALAERDRLAEALECIAVLAPVSFEGAGDGAGSHFRVTYDCLTTESQPGVIARTALNEGADA